MNVCFMQIAALVDGALTVILIRCVVMQSDQAVKNKMQTEVDVWIILKCNSKDISLSFLIIFGKLGKFLHSFKHLVNRNITQNEWYCTFKDFRSVDLFQNIITGTQRWIMSALQQSTYCIHLLNRILMR